MASLARRPYWIVVYGIEAWSALPGTKRAALRQADRVIVISTFSREQVARRHQINGERLASLPCTLDESLLMRVAKYGDPGQRDWLSSWSLPWQGSPDFPPSQSAVTGNKRVVLTVGRMAASERYKGHEVVLRALPSVVAKIPDLTYVVVGDGERHDLLKRQRVGTVRLQDSGTDAGQLQEPVDMVKALAETRRDIHGEPLPPALLDHARRAAEACPTFALRVERDRGRA